MHTIGIYVGYSFVEVSLQALVKVKWDGLAIEFQILIVMGHQALNVNYPLRYVWLETLLKKF